LPAASDGIAARAVMRMHEPDFLDASLIHPAQPLPTPALMEAQEPHTHPSPEAPGAGRRAEGEPKTEPRIPTKPVQPPAPSVAAVVGQKALSGETQAPVHRVSTFDVNLLSAEYTRTFQNVNPLAVLLSWAVVTALVAGVGYGLLALYEVRATARLAEAKRVASALEETIATYEDLSAEDSVLRRKVAAAQELINDHVSWHAFLGKLEEVTIPEITYTSMAASTAGVMNITALAGDYTGLARQMVVFQETPWITDITITAATRVEESPTQPPGVSFDMSLEVSPDVLFTDARYD
ncbi:MAG: hypothetical protein HYW81_01440, partial [Parcubacteria group bacterium]|nr:hypothetical protein [Parcubacteria group bacterium]